MSFTYTVDVFCDACGYWIHGATSKAKSSLPSRADEVARRAGWLVGRDNFHLCPECKKKAASEEAAKAPQEELGQDRKSSL